ncbi:hypothetical protein BDY19DRAFT_910454 [Irpex rosettiformis]|uniref:Uncharacterized protein n=1 Tax=Irpex rosettiformis TaxID=378272 RepID=A0ACB8TNR8_9APHY|nr:hypothetical protein BDY19DRAFT_910454 [Irpex rosettiformis]
MVPSTSTKNHSDRLRACIAPEGRRLHLALQRNSYELSYNRKTAMPETSPIRTQNEKWCQWKMVMHSCSEYAVYHRKLHYVFVSDIPPTVLEHGNTIIPDIPACSFFDRLGGTIHIQILFGRNNYYTQEAQRIKFNIPALYIYDYALTLPLEIQYVWWHECSVTSILFLVNRYAMLCYTALEVVEFVPWTSTSVQIADKLRHRSQARKFFITFRIYALWNKNLKIFVCVLVLGLMYPIGYIYYATRLVRLAYPPPITGCLSYSVLPARLTPKAGADTLLYVILFSTIKHTY